MLQWLVQSTLDQEVPDTNKATSLTMMAYALAQQLDAEVIVNHFIQDLPRKLFCKSILFDEKK